MAVIRASAKFASAETGVRFAASLTSDMASPIYSPPFDVGSDLLGKGEISGLTPGQLYYISPAPAAGIQTPAMGTARAPKAGASSFKFVASNCADANSNIAAFDAIRTLDPDFMIFNGDFHYGNVMTDSVGSRLTQYSISYTAKRTLLMSAMRVHYKWSDHDSNYQGDGTSYANKDAVGWPSAQAAYRARVPHPTLPNAAANYHSFQEGRVLFLMTDDRSQRDPENQTDNASKSLLGATQKAWVKAQIDYAAANGLIVCWVTDIPWQGDGSKYDDWTSYTTERAEIANYIKAAGMGDSGFWIGGDRHFQAIDDGSHMDFATGGGMHWPCMQNGALKHSATTGTNGTWSHGSFPGENQLGLVEVTDTGLGTVGVTFTAYRAASTSDPTLTVLATLSFSVAIPSTDKNLIGAVTAGAALGGALTVNGTNNLVGDVAASAAVEGALTVTAGDVLFLNDSMTPVTADEDLTAHLPELGGAWSYIFGYTASGGPKVSAAGRAWAAGSAGNMRNAAVPASADYYVEAEMEKLTTVSGQNIGVCARISDTAQTFYYLRLGGGNAWQLYRVVGTTATQVKNTTGVTINVGEVFTLRLEVQGAVVRGFKNGVRVFTDYTDPTPITDKGFPGLQARTQTTNSSGIQINWIKAGSLMLP